MTFDKLNPIQKRVAQCGLKFCRERYGKNGLRIGEEIHSSISWKPTFYLKPSPFLIIAAEVDEVLYPPILRIAANDIRHYDFPIQVFSICPLDVYLTDSKQTTVNELKRHGFGIITVDDVGLVTQQWPCIPLAQFISPHEMETEIAGLTPSLKVKFRSAHTTYLAKEGQGLQEAGQIIEAMVDSIAAQSIKFGLTLGTLKASTADKIDALYDLKSYKDIRAALGGTRDFVKEYRNTASHAPNSAKKAMEKIRKCRAGFLDAIRVAKNLQAAAKTKGCRLRIHL